MKADARVEQKKEYVGEISKVSSDPKTRQTLDFPLLPAGTAAVVILSSTLTESLSIS